MRYSRTAVASLALGCLITTSGCTEWFKRLGQTQHAEDSNFIPPTPEQLVAYLNRQSSPVQSIFVEDVTLEARKGLFSAPAMRGWMVCHKPRHFRLQGSVSGHPGVDIGSNSDEFWFWVNQSDGDKPMPLLHCRHDEASRAQLPFPFHPDWVLEAMGMATYGPAERYKVNVPNRGDTIELIEDSYSPQGQPVRKVTVFARRNTGGAAPQVRSRLLTDMRGKEISSIHIEEVRLDPSGVVVPRQVRLEYPAERVTMHLTLDTISVNGSVTDQRLATWFTRPTLSGIQTVNMARVSPPPGQPASQPRPFGGAFRGLMK
jgi:hypothetical protein